MTVLIDDLACEEKPAFFQAGPETLFGIFSRVQGLPNRTGVVISSGGLTGTSTVGRNQMFVRLARRLAAMGHPTLRFDYHGIGESTGILEEFRLDVADPFVTDIVGAAGWMRNQGIERLIVFGKCFGSRMALTAAPLIDQLHGLILVGAPVRDFGNGERGIARLATDLTVPDLAKRAFQARSIRRLADPKYRNAYAKVVLAKLRSLRSAPSAAGTSSDGPRWVSPYFVKPFKQLLERGIPIQLIHGVEDEFYQDFLTAKEQSGLGGLLERFSSQVNVAVTPGQVRGFAQVAVQDAIIEAACSWVRQQDGDADRS